MRRPRAPLFAMLLTFGALAAPTSCARAAGPSAAPVGAGPRAAAPPGRARLHEADEHMGQARALDSLANDAEGRAELYERQAQASLERARRERERSQGRPEPERARALAGAATLEAGARIDRARAAEERREAARLRKQAGAYRERAVAAARGLPDPQRRDRAAGAPIDPFAGGRGSLGGRGARGGAVGARAGSGGGLSRPPPGAAGSPN